MKSYKELLSNDPLREAIRNVVEGRDFVVVHAKKGKMEVKNASSAYDAAQKAAKKWGLKSTAGVDAHLAEDNTNDKSDDGEGLDKVQPKAVKKKFKDRKDKDIDNDGDEDDSDEFLHKKRKAISKAMAKEDVDKADETPSGADDDAEDEAPKKKKKKKEDGEKDTPSVKDSGAEVIDTEPKLDENKKQDDLVKRINQKHADRMAAKLKDKDKKRDKFLKRLKKEDFARYGERAEAVMEAVAEKLANK